MFKKTVLAAAVLLGTSVTAQAATWQFSYEITPSNLVTGSFEGDLQADLNTILLTGTNGELALDGTPHSSVINTVFNFGAGAARVTLDGSLLSFVLTTPIVDNGFTIVTGSTAQYYDIGNGLNLSGVATGAWSVSEVTAPVPLPASLGLMLAGLAGLGLARRRRG